MACPMPRYGWHEPALWGDCEPMHVLGVLYVLGVHLWGDCPMHDCAYVLGVRLWGDCPMGN